VTTTLFWHLSVLLDLLACPLIAIRTEAFFVVGALQNDLFAPCEKPFPEKPTEPTEHQLLSQWEQTIHCSVNFEQSGEKGREKEREKEKEYAPKEWSRSKGLRRLRIKQGPTYSMSMYTSHGQYAVLFY
jgi:hypothetical protein